MSRVFKGLFFCICIMSAEAFGAQLPDVLKDIPLPGVNLYAARTARESGDPVGPKESVVGALPDKSVTLQISPDAVRVEFNGNAGFNADEMAKAYLKAMSLKGARLLNVVRDEDEPKYNGLWVFEMPVGGVTQKMALWINGRSASQHYWYVWPVKNVQLTAQEMQKKINETGAVSLYLNFDNNKSLIRPVDRPQLEQAAGMLKKNQQLNLRVEGHTDNVGQAKTNLTLSAYRAQSVVDALVAMGVAKDRLTSLGLGDTKPLSDNASPEGRAKNRRVELVKR